MNKFENIFKSMWKTAKKRNIFKKDVEKEIEEVRKEKIKLIVEKLNLDLPDILKNLGEESKEEKG